MTLRRIFTSIICLAAALSAAGQTISNPAFADSLAGHKAQAELFGRKDNGGIIPISGSPDSFEAGASANAYHRLSEKIVFFGLLGWDYFRGKNMGGAILMDPYFNPVNFLERDEDTRGTKYRETYNLEGGIAYRFSPAWAAGLSVKYQAADQTKLKDPRFSNTWMDLDINAGASFRAGERLVLGASLRYRSTLENVRGGIYGTTDKQYFIATDKGGFLGLVSELAGDYGIISTSSATPMVNYFYGGALQAVLDGKFKNELFFHVRNGYYGSEGSSSPRYFDYNGLETGYKGSLKAGSHHMALDICFANISNTENKFQYITPAGKNTIVQYTGKDVVLRRSVFKTSFEYSWKNAVGILLGSRYIDQSASLFPLGRKTQVTTLSADIWGRKTLWKRLTIELHALAVGGFGNAAEDSASASATSTTIRSFDSYMNRQFEYDTALRAGGRLSATCQLPAIGKTSPYVRISEQYVHLLKTPQYLEGSGRNMALIGLGLTF